MKATDVIGWVVDGDIYCVDCTPTNEGHPIFAESETDSFSHCDTCEALIPETLTAEGWAWVIETAEDWLTRRQGRPEIQRQWWEHVKAWRDDGIIELWGKSLEEENVKHALVNTIRQAEGFRAALDKAGECDITKYPCTDPTCSAIRIIKKMFNL